MIVRRQKLLFFNTINIWQYICLAKVNQMDIKKITLGEFEEIVLLNVAIMDGNGYGAAITIFIAETTKRPVQVSAVHMALYRLEEKRLVSSRLGGATTERGGRRKRLYSITPFGIKVIEDIRRMREQLWGLIPKHI
jgi:PadR family transcriptional regulator, regulatory protein PadR